MTQSMLTLLFSDIEGSTRWWEREPERMAISLERHDRIVRQTVVQHHGHLVKMTGDGAYAAFEDPLDAVLAAVDLQRDIAEASAAEGAVPLQIRCGIHAGLVQLRGGDYFGPEVNRAARIMSSAHGGQTLASRAVMDLIRGRLPANISILDLGRVRLRDLSVPDQLCQLAAPGLASEFPRLRSLETTPNNLPGQISSFVGRQQDLSEIAALVRSRRLVTLVGPGGVGKTRLSVHVGAELLDDFPDGVWFVELAPLTAGALVAQAVAQVLAVRESGTVPVEAALAARCEGRTMLLILDNCEHVIEACARLCERLLASAPTLSVVASSREPLRIAGEQVRQVVPLSLLPPTHATVGSSEAAQLFIERALSHTPGLELDEAARHCVDRICDRLDAIPLAIELAAARIRILSVKDIHARLNDRFKLLTSGDRNAQPRQQTLRALEQWSYDLLRPQEQRLFARIAVFAGGFDIAAAECVGGSSPVRAGDVLDLLAGLVEKSLVVAETRGAYMRYRMLESLREFARERLTIFGEEDTARERHAHYYLAVAKRAHTRIEGAEMATAVRELEHDHDNLRAALDWFEVEAPTAAGGLELGGYLLELWLVNGHASEGRRRLAAMLARPDSNAPDVRALRASALYSSGSLAMRPGEIADAVRPLSEALELWRQVKNEARISGTLSMLGRCAAHQKDYDQAIAYQLEATDILASMNDERHLAPSYCNLGNVYNFKGDYGAAIDMFKKSLALCAQVGYPLCEVFAAKGFGTACLHIGEPREALAHFERSRVVAQENEFHSQVKATDGDIAIAGAELGNWELACAALGRAFSNSNPWPSPVHEAQAIFAAAKVAIGRLQPALALTTLAVLDAHRALLNDDEYVNNARVASECAIASAKLSQMEARDAWAQGGRLSMSEVGEKVLRWLRG